MIAPDACIPHCTLKSCNVICGIDTAKLLICTVLQLLPIPLPNVPIEVSRWGQHHPQEGNSASYGNCASYDNLETMPI
jgi:hypothetical protein